MNPKIKPGITAHRYHGVTRHATLHIAPPVEIQDTVIYPYVYDFTDLLTYIKNTFASGETEPRGPVPMCVKLDLEHPIVLKTSHLSTASRCVMVTHIHSDGNTTHSEYVRGFMYDSHLFATDSGVGLSPGTLLKFNSRTEHSYKESRIEGFNVVGPDDLRFVADDVNQLYVNTIHELELACKDSDEVAETTRIQNYVIEPVETELLSFNPTTISEKLVQTGLTSLEFLGSDLLELNRQGDQPIERVVSHWINYALRTNSTPFNKGIRNVTQHVRCDRMYLFQQLESMFGDCGLEVNIYAGENPRVVERIDQTRITKQNAYSHFIATTVQNIVTKNDSQGIIGGLIEKRNNEFRYHVDGDGLLDGMMKYVMPSLNYWLADTDYSIRFQYTRGGSVTVKLRIENDLENFQDGYYELNDYIGGYIPEVIAPKEVVEKNATAMRNFINDISELIKDN